MLSLHGFLPRLIDAATHFEAINWVELRCHTFRFFLSHVAELSDRASNDLQKAYLHGESCR
jgi:hypothetical protein